MDRAAPLVPVTVLAGVILLILLVLFLTSRRLARDRAPWLFPELLVLAVFAAIHLLFFWRAYRTPAQVPAGGGDLTSFFYPLHSFAAREFEAGRLPLWNPHQYGGAPHLGNFQAAVLYPPNLVAYLLPGDFSYARLEFLALFHYFLASIGGYWLARAVGLGRVPGVLAGSVFAYSGFMVAHLGHYSMLSTAAWAPLLFAGIVAATRRRSWLIALGIVPVLASCVLGGHQPMLLMVLSVAVLLALFELWRAAASPHPRDWAAILRDRESQLGLARLAVPALLALGLTAPALGPAFELTRYSSRSALDYQAASEFSVEPLALLHLILPTIYGSNPTDFWGPFSSTEIWGYAGVVTLLLAGFSLVSRHVGRTQLFWGLVAILSLIYALGPYTPLHGWLYSFAPAYDRLRAAGRALMFFDLAVGLLAAYGLAAMLRPRVEWRDAERFRLKVGLFGLAGVVPVVTLFVIPLFAVEVLGVNDPPNRPMIALDNLILLALFLALALGVGVSAYFGKLYGGALAVVVIALVLLDISRATAPFNPTDAPILSGFEHPETVAFLVKRQDESRPFRIESLSSAWQPDAARVHGLEDIGGLVDPLALEDYLQYLNRARQDRTSSEYRDLNVRYILTDGDAEAPAPDASVVHEAESLTIWELQDWRDRAWLEVDGERLDVDIESSHAGSLRLELPENHDGGRLVVSQAWYPGWEAEISGESRDVERHAGALQSVDVPSGAEAVALEYRPSRMTVWIATSAVSAVAWLTALIVVVRRRRAVGARA